MCTKTMSCVKVWKTCNLRLLTTDQEKRKKKKKETTAAKYNGHVVYVAEVLVVIQYNVLVVTSGYTRSVVV